MPRKGSKTEKPPLLFLERTLCGARLQNVPEVRAAINPRDFFTETQAQSSSNSSSTSLSWVNPQFEGSLAVAPPARRGGRRKCHSVASILDSYTQPSRKTSVCKFPSLSFQTRSRDQPNQPKTTHTNKATESAVVSDAGNQPRVLRRTTKRSTSVAQHSDTPRRQTTTIRNINVERFSDVAAASGGSCLDRPEAPSAQAATESCRIQADCATSPASTECNSDCPPPPPDVDTPKVMQEGSTCRPSTALNLLLPQPCTPTACNKPNDILVADTPERDYGVKVTWRRRKGLMTMLKDRGHMSESDVLIHS